MCAKLIDRVMSASAKNGFDRKVYDVIGIVLFISMPGDKVVNTVTGEMYETKHINVHLASCLTLDGKPTEFTEDDWFTIPPAWKAAANIEVGSLVHLNRRYFKEGEITLKDGTPLPEGVRLDMADSQAWTAAQTLTILDTIIKDEETTGAERKTFKQLKQAAVAVSKS